MTTTCRSNVVLNIAKIVGLSFASTLLAATILGSALFGPFGIFAGPVLMLFGWFYAPIIISIHFLAWVAWPVFGKLKLGRLVFALSGAICGACLFACIGVKEEGSFFYFTVAYAISAGVAGLFSCMMIVLCHRAANLDNRGC
jgi:hypothetical protein